MKLVRFNRDFAPHHRGDEKVLPDRAAEAAVSQGIATVLPSPFDDRPEVAAPLPTRRERRRAR